MADQKTPYTLVLSPAELRWLAGSFGLTRLALPVALPPASAGQLHAAQETLAERGLIRRDPGTGWQVDQLAAFLVQWLGTVEAYTRLEVHPRRGEPVRAGIYSLQGLYLLAGCAAEQIECLFLPDEKALLAELVRRLDLGTARAVPQGCFAREGGYTLPQPLELIRAAWQDPGDALSQSKGPARRALINAGLSKREAASTLAWVESLSIVILFEPFPRNDKRSFHLCSDGATLWAGKAEPGSGGARFTACSLKEARARIREIL